MSRAPISAFHLLWLLPLVFLLGLGSGYLLWGRSAGSADVASTPSLLDDDAVLGPADAPVTIVEFGDYQCPYCQYWHNAILPQLLATYADKVRYVYRDFPLTGHPQAIPAAVAANCAAEQDAFWKFHDALFSMTYGLDEEAYRRYAANLGLATDQFAECLNSGRARQEVLDDYRAALRLGVQSTPTFFINDVPLVGAQPFEAFQQIIEAELARKDGQP